jgi:hypothetical protein
MLTTSSLRALHALMLTCVMSVAGFAQSSGSIAGTVKDSNGGVVPGASISASDATRGITQTVTTNAEGDFVFPLLPPGTYTLSTGFAGFKKSERSGVVVPVASKVSVGDIVLEVGKQTDTVTVEAEAGQLEVQTESGGRHQPPAA